MHNPHQVIIGTTSHRNHVPPAETSVAFMQVAACLALPAQLFPSPQVATSPVIYLSPIPLGSVPLTPPVAQLAGAFSLACGMLAAVARHRYAALCRSVALLTAGSRALLHTLVHWELHQQRYDLAL